MSTPAKQDALDRMSTTISVGAFLAVRQIKRASLATTALIIFVMTLTFLNVVVVNGILVGLIIGSSNAYRNQFSADILIVAPKGKASIERVTQIESIMNNFPEIESYTTRYLAGGKIQGDYKKTRKAGELADDAGTQVAGINPVREEAVTHLSSLIKHGSYLGPNDTNQVLVGEELIAKYSQGDFAGTGTISGGDIGSKIQIDIGGATKEVIVKGILGSKVDTVDRRVFIVDRELLRLIDRDSNNADEIAVKLKPGYTPEQVKDGLVRSGVDQWALIQTWEESQGAFFKQITATFAGLGAMIGAIGLTVASITIFIVVFINAVTRKRYIGILKGIGMRPQAIELSYVLIALFYAIFGVALGSLFLFGWLKPFIDANPIDFPFSDGILVAEPADTAIRIGLIMVTTLVAGYLPARNIIKKNTLDSILGR